MANLVIRRSSNPHTRQAAYCISRQFILRILHWLPPFSAAILQARLYGLYSKSKRLLALMIPLYVLSVVAAIIMVLKSTGKVTSGECILWSIAGLIESYKLTV